MSPERDAKFKRWYGSPLIFLVVVLGSLLISACNPSGDSSEQESPPAVQNPNPGTLPPPPPATPETWANTYDAGGPSTLGSGTANLALPTGDGGYILAGEAQLNVWALKLDNSGSVSWSKVYGSTRYEVAQGIYPTADGGYLVAAQSIPAVGNPEALVLKLDAVGNIAWQNRYENTGYVSAAQPTGDGGHVLTGYRYGPTPGSPAEPWVLKLDDSGNVQWHKTYVDSRLGSSRPSAIQETIDGGLIVVGRGGTGPDPTDPMFRAWALKLDADGDVVWYHNFGGSLLDEFDAVRQSSDGGYFISGIWGSLDNVWVIKLDSDGYKVWGKTYGPGRGSSIEPTGDGGCIVAGSTLGTLLTDALVLRLDTDGNIVWQKSYGGLNTEAAAQIQSTSDAGYLLLGSISNSYYNSYGAWLLKLGIDGMVSLNPASGVWASDSSVVTENPLSGFLLATISYADAATTAVGANDTSADLPVVVEKLTAPSGVVPAPTNLVAVPIPKSGGGFVQLSWTNETANALGTTIFRSTDNVGFGRVATVAPGVTTYTDIGGGHAPTQLPFGTYFYKLEAFDESGYSDFSDTSVSLQP